ncbi:hypothetical protein DL768_010402 [Monosporascus sp. mg162]|nr:hypothetical protein DL768_010402 [Monosporascus sp. mg162]
MPPKYERCESTPDVTESTEIATIQIPSGKRFTAHTILLAHHSKYFRAALNSAMKEATTLHFDLTEHATKFSVALFVKWLYAQSTLDYSGDHLAAFSGWIDQVEDDEVIGELCAAWLLGDYLHVPEFKNFIIMLLDPRLETVIIWRHPLLYPYPSLKEVNLNSKLHDLFVDTLACLVSNSKATADPKLILERLDVDTKTKLLQRFIIGTRVVRREARDAYIRYQHSTSDSEECRTATTVVDSALLTIGFGKFLDLDGLEPYLDEEEE